MYMYLLYTRYIIVVVVVAVDRVGSHRDVLMHVLRYMWYICCSCMYFLFSIVFSILDPVSRSLSLHITIAVRVVSLSVELQVH